jgi:folate-binding protein YgfZ
MTSVAIDLRGLPHQQRALIHASGPDALRFLQGLLSADLAICTRQRAIPATLLTIKGKILADLIVWGDEEAGFSLAVPVDEREAVHAKLDRHLIMDDVVLDQPDPADAALAIVWGASAPAAADGVQRLETEVPVRGWLLCGSDDALAGVLSGVQGADVESWNRQRVLDATPAWGFEIAADWFPPEVGHVAAVSYSKGCFLGQEPLSRIHSRGRVNRVMVRVSFDPSWKGDVASLGALASDERPEAGRVTTTASSSGKGLAIVHRSLASPGTRLRAGALEVTVESGPLGDDEGVGSTPTSTVKLGGR